MKFGDVITLPDALFISMFSIVVVFLVLLAISYMIDVIAWFVRRGQGKTQSPAAGQGAKTTAGNGHADAVLVSAAVAAYLQREPGQFIVHSVRRLPGGESLWSQESRRESLQ